MATFSTTTPESISFNYRPIDLGSAKERFGVVVEVSCSFNILNSTFLDGDILTEGIEEFRNSYLNRDITIIINEVSYQNCRVRSVSVPETTRTTRQQATLSFEYDIISGDSVMGSLATAVVANPIESFSQSWEYKKSNTGYEFSRSFNIQVAANVNSANEATNFNNLVTLFNSLFKDWRPNITGLSLPINFADLNNRSYVSEEIDIINLTASFSETLSVNTNLDGSFYSSLITSKTTKQRGQFTSKSISSQIQVHQEPIENNTKLAVALERDIVKNLAGVDFNFTSYRGDCNETSGTGSVEFTFDNNPLRDGNVLESFSVERRLNGVDEDYTLSGEILGLGIPISQKLQKAKTKYLTIAASPTSKITELFGAVGSIYKVSESYSESESNGTISYSYTYSTNPEYSSGGCIRNLSTSTSETKRVIIKNYSESIEGEQIRMESNNSNIGVVRSTCSLKTGPSCCGGYLAAATFEQSAINEAEMAALTLLSEIPSDCYFLTSKSTTVNKYEGSYSASLEYFYK